jgi:hypothetical protein
MCCQEVDANHRKQVPAVEATQTAINARASAMALIAIALPDHCLRIIFYGEPVSIFRSMRYATAA